MFYILLYIVIILFYLHIHLVGMWVPVKLLVCFPGFLVIFLKHLESLAIFGSSCRRLPAHHGPAGSRQGIRAPTKWGCSPVQWPYQWSKSGENGFQWRLLDGYPPEIKHGNEKSSIHRSLVMFQPCLILSMEEILHSTLDWNMLKPHKFSLNL